MEDSSALGYVVAFQNTPQPLLDFYSLNVSGEGAYPCQELGSVPFHLLFLLAFS